MKKYLLLITLLIALQPIKAQHTENKEFENQNSYLTFDLVSPILFNEISRYTIGYVQNLPGRWKLGGSIGYGNKNINFVTESKTNYSLIEFRPEVYYFLNKKLPLYFSGELFYINHRETLFNDKLTFNLGNEGILFDQADYKRIKIGGVLKIGTMTHLTDKLKLNFYCGAGVRARDNTFRNIVNPVVDVDMKGYIINPFRRQEGTRIGLEFSLGLKLFYKL